MMFQTPAQIQARISLGVFLVWIGIIATAAGSFLYWGMTTQVFDPEYMAKQNYYMQASLYGMLLLAFVIEAYKKAMLGSFKSRKLWYWLVFASVLTSVGGTMIINQTRQNSLITNSNTYTTAEEDLKEAKAKRAIFARCSAMTLDGLNQRIASNKTNPPKLSNGKTNWGMFHSIKNKAKEDKICLDNYETADANVTIAKAELRLASSNGGGGAGIGVSSNPLMSSIHKLIGTAEETLVMLFYILITVLLEAVTFYIGSEVEAAKRRKTLTENEIIVLNVYENLGIDLSATQDKIVKKGMTLEMDHELKEERQKLEYEIARQSMLNEMEAQKAVVMGAANAPIIVATPVPSQSNTSVNNTGGSSALDGLSYAELVGKNAIAKANTSSVGKCVTCNTEFNRANNSLYCTSDHSREFQRVLKRAKRAEGIS